MKQSIATSGWVISGLQVVHKELQKYVYESESADLALAIVLDRLLTDRFARVESDIFLSFSNLFGSTFFSRKIRGTKL